MIPVPAFLIRHPSAGAILVDTGLHPSIATDGKENFGGLGNRIGKPTLEAGEDVPAQLRKRGLDPGEIPVVVMTHMHSDHTSAISEFPNSTFVVSETEWEAAATGSQPTLNGYRRPHFDYAFDYRTVDFDRAGIDSYASFGRTFDLFGDGSIRLAFTPGHSAGHMSVICRLAAGRLRDRRRRDVHGRPSSTATRRCRRAPSTPTTSAARCRSCGSSTRQFPDAMITPGHDPDFYARLDCSLRVASPSYISRTSAKTSRRRPRAGARGSAPARPRRSSARRTGP